MTAAKIMDIISRCPGCDGQAADAVSAYTQVKMEDAPNIVFPKSETVKLVVCRETSHERHRPLYEHTPQATRTGTFIKLLLKSGNLMNGR